jgi:hypothetical protein
MSTLYSVNLVNEFAEARLVGRISKVRPGAGDHAGKVVNTTIVLSRSYKEMKDGAEVLGTDNRPIWHEKTMFLDLALWGTGVKFFKAASGDVLMADFNLADLTASQYTKDDGTTSMNYKVGRVNFLKVVARKNATGGDTPVQEEPIPGAEPAEENIPL